MGGGIVRLKVLDVLVVKCPSVSQLVEIVGEDAETPEPEMCGHLFEASCHAGCKEDEVFRVQGMLSMCICEQGGSSGDQQEEEAPFQDKAGESFQMFLLKAGVSVPFLSVLSGEGFAQGYFHFWSKVCCKGRSCFVSNQ